jgi:hypothetical protein
LKNFSLKIFLLLFAFFSLFLGVIFRQPAQAQSLFFGQQHNYSVTMRGNGEAVVYGRLLVTNTNEEDQTRFNFEVPDASVSEMIIFQQILEPACSLYDYQKPDRPCLEYSKPDPNSFRYSYGNYKYQKVKFEQTDNRFTLEIPEPIKPQESGAIIIGYSARGYVKETFGLHNFVFKTLKVNNRISEARVAVNVDSEFILKGAKATVDYAQPEISSDAFAIKSGVSAPSSSLDNVSRQAGTSGALVKQATALAPGDTFEVKGEFAGNRGLLYWKEWSASILVLSLILVVAFVLSRWSHKRAQKHPVKQEDQNKSEQSKAQTVQSFYGFRINYVLFGLLSAALIMIFTGFLVYLSEVNWFDDISLNPFMSVILVIIIATAYILAIVGPAAFVAVRGGGWKAFLAALIYAFGWLVIFFLLYLALFNDTTSTKPEPYPYTNEITPQTVVD